MEKKEKMRLTNEEVTKKFKSSFDLVNYAITLAENMIQTGRETRVKSDVQNRAMLVLEEIHQGKDHLDEIETETPPSASDINSVIPQLMMHAKRHHVTSGALEREK